MELCTSYTCSTLIIVIMQFEIFIMQINLSLCLLGLRSLQDNFDDDILDDAILSRVSLIHNNKE